MFGRLLTALLAGASCFFAARAAHAYHDENTPWITGTAYTLREREFSLGILEWDVGIVDQVMIGTLGPLWLAWPIFGAPVPNASFKLRSWFAGPLVVSLGGTFLYLDGTSVLESDTAQGQEDLRFLVFNGTAAGSYRANDVFTASLDATFAKADVNGTSPHASVAGAAVTDSFRVGAAGEFRLSRYWALQLKGRMLLYRREPTFVATLHPDPWTDVDAELTVIKLAPRFAPNATAAFAFSGKNVNFAIGGGYGYGWVPLIDFALPTPGVILDFDFFVRF
jgi:hypothetical protein